MTTHGSNAPASRFPGLVLLLISVPAYFAALVAGFGSNSGEWSSTVTTAAFLLVPVGMVAGLLALLFPRRLRAAAWTGVAALGATAVVAAIVLLVVPDGTDPKFTDTDARVGLGFAAFTMAGVIAAAVRLKRRGEAAGALAHEEQAR